MSAPNENKHEESPPLAGVIAAHRFFADMKPEHLKRLEKVAMFKTFERGEVVFREGEPANRFYLICKGKIALEYGGANRAAPMVQFVGEGEELGWSWLFPPYYWHFSARAFEPTTAIFFYGTRLREECDEVPAFGYDLMKRVAAVVVKRLQMTRLQLFQLQEKSG